MFKCTGERGRPVGEVQFDAINKHWLDWENYAWRFMEILRARKIEETVSKDVIDHGRDLTIIFALRSLMSTA